MLFGIGARRWGRVRRQRSRRRRTRSRARGRGDFVGFISPSSVGIVRGLTVLNAVRSSHAALPKGHAPSSVGNKSSKTEANLNTLNRKFSSSDGAPFVSTGYRHASDFASSV